MSDQAGLLVKIEDKIRALGEQLVAASAENHQLKDEINALKNKISDLEAIFDESSEYQNGRKPDQIDSIKKELDKYISEVEHCIEMVKSI